MTEAKSIKDYHLDEDCVTAQKIDGLTSTIAELTRIMELVVIDGVARRTAHVGNGQLSTIAHDPASHSKFNTAEAIMRENAEERVNHPEKVSGGAQDAVLLLARGEAHFAAKAGDVEAFVADRHANPLRTVIQGENAHDLFPRPRVDTNEHECWRAFRSGLVGAG